VEGDVGRLRPKTQVGYESVLNRHVLLEFGAARVAAIKVAPGCGG